MAEISFDKVVGYLFIIDSMTLETHEAPLWFAPIRYFANLIVQIIGNRYLRLFQKKNFK